MVLTRLALRARVLTLAAMFAVLAGGVWTVTQLQVELLPNIDFPLVTVSASYPQADQETVLRDLTEPLERVAADTGVDGFDAVRSITFPGFVLVLAEFEFGSDMKEAERIISERVSDLSFPPGVQTPQITRFNPDEFPILQLSVLGPQDPDVLRELVTSEILPKLRELPGVLNAELPLESQTEEAIIRTNGRASLAITVVKEPDANTVAVANAVLEELEKAESELPFDVEFIVIANQAPDIQDSVDTLTQEVVLGGLLAILVVFAFLLSVRPTIVTGISIPISLLGGLIIMGWQDMTLNIITLGALAISAGRVVDDSIVVMENIYRHIQRGEDRVQAALDATREVSVPIITSTLTTIAVFAPLGFIGGFIGTFFLPFALTITYTLLASLVVALTVIPVLGSLLIKHKGTENLEDERETFLQRAYTPILRWSLGHKALTLLAAVVIFIGSLGLLPFIPQSFLPGFGQNVLTVEMTLPPGSSFQATIQQLDEVEAVLADLRTQGVVTDYQSRVGGIGDIFGPGGGVGGGSNTANIFVTLPEEEDALALAESMRRDLAGPGRDLFISQAQGGGPASNALELVFLGEDYPLVVQTAARVVESLQRTEGLINVRSDAALGPDGAVATRGAAIVRVNGTRAVTVSGVITARNTGAMNQTVTNIVDQVGLPAGVELSTGGVFADIAQAFAAMGLAMLIGVALVYLTMVVSQRSLLTPLIIVFSLPLASIGAFGALFLTQRTLGLPALLGMLMLIGLVVTNAIVLIDFVNRLRGSGRSVYEALMEGGRIRLRPILMTAFTTSFALLPLALDTSGGSGIIGAELATVVIGGLMTSTFLTLVVIPVVYRLLRRDKSPAQPPPLEPVPAGASD